MSRIHQTTNDVDQLSCNALQPPSTTQLPRRHHRPVPPALQPEDDDDVDGNSNNSLLCYWCQHCVWPGLGLFGESYLLFSVGTLLPLWTVLFPDCIRGDSCAPALLHAMTYSVVLGVILGMITMGMAANKLGRRWGSLTTATVMSVGALGMTIAASLSSSISPAHRFLLLSSSLFVLGIGIGGEYPLAASSATEKAMLLAAPSSSDFCRRRSSGDGLYVAMQDTTAVVNGPMIKRGQQVQLVFTMQGLGIFANSALMTVLLAIYDDDQEGPTGDALLLIWRTIYVVGTLVLLVVLLTRYWYLPESHIWQKDQEQAHAAQLVVQQQQQQHGVSDAHTTMAAGGAVVGPSPPPHQAIPWTTMTLPEINLTTSPSQLSNAATSVSSLSVPSVAVPPIHQVDSNDDDSDNAAAAAAAAAHMWQALPDEDEHFDAAAAAAVTAGVVVGSNNIYPLLLRNYGVRLLGASASWLLWDVAFYGNKLFQSVFILTLTGAESTSLLAFSAAATLNAGVALLGYFGAALLIDHPQVGRRRLQVGGFVLTGLLFVSCGFFYESLSNTTLVVLYLGSSFFGQLGPNATTFLMPAEIFPTEVRTQCHGTAAAAGKVGALIAAVLFHYVNQLDLFLLSGYCSLAAAAISAYTLPNTRGLDLRELDRKWHLTKLGRKREYVGAANHPKYWSVYERQHKTRQLQNEGSNGTPGVAAWEIDVE